MADRLRSKDGSRDTDKVFGDGAGVAHQGRTDGRLARDVGSRDELKRANERPAGATRVRKSDTLDNDAEDAG
ncbi:hypothetical protein [Cognatishimia sp. F0-27]|uniref:hypothetical protein n=1 Tax=Cognatishimia sp. F0-27 TaxID=2816855 RepID=UPI001D0C97BC|nr:hypothetical protein [Cognatishimia sp. F0-27]MCC1494924.1 hypothetical protein [Cognatishimia sp. F0-27]